MRLNSEDRPRLNAAAVDDRFPGVRGVRVEEEDARGGSAGAGGLGTAKGGSDSSCPLICVGGDSDGRTSEV
jgi:hypothetical protein